MIIQNISAGLGNQMFMYAFGRAISLEYGETLYLDISAFGVDYLRKYGLDKLSIGEDVQILQQHPVLYGLCNFKKKLFANIIKVRHESLDCQEIVDKYAKYGFFYCTSRKYIYPMYANKILNYYYGMFQSEKYFKKYSDIIKRELRVSAPINSECKRLAEQVEKEHSVCVHIRRGDYLKSKIHNVCNYEFYKKAISIMRDHIHNAKFYFFSDDCCWVKEHFKDQNYYIVDINNKDYEDLYLMYHCKNFIIPNSTFSWWAQYLSDSRNKLVIAPDRWYNGLPKDSTDIFMDSWIKIPVAE